MQGSVLGISYYCYGPHYSNESSILYHGAQSKKAPNALISLPSFLYQSSKNTVLFEFLCACANIKFEAWDFSIQI